MSEIEGNVRIVSHEVKRDYANPTRVAVTFVVGSKAALDARDYTLSDEIMQKGAELCEKIPLMRVGIDTQGVPCYCNKSGEALDLNFIEFSAADESTEHYYRVTHNYIGIR